MAILAQIKGMYHVGVFSVRSLKLSAAVEVKIGKVKKEIQKSTDAHSKDLLSVQNPRLTCIADKRVNKRSAEKEKNKNANAVTGSPPKKAKNGRQVVEEAPATWAPTDGGKVPEISRP